MYLNIHLKSDNRKYVNIRFPGFDNLVWIWFKTTSFVLRKQTTKYLKNRTRYIMFNKGLLKKLRESQLTHFYCYRKWKSGWGNGSAGKNGCTSMRTWVWTTGTHIEGQVWLHVSKTQGYGGWRQEDLLGLAGGQPGSMCSKKSCLKGKGRDWQTTAASILFWPPQL